MADNSQVNNEPSNDIQPIFSKIWVGRDLYDKYADDFIAYAPNQFNMHAFNMHDDELNSYAIVNDYYTDPVLMDHYYNEEYYPEKNGIINLQPSNELAENSGNQDCPLNAQEHKFMDSKNDHMDLLQLRLSSIPIVTLIVYRIVKSSMSSTNDNANEYAWELW